MRNRKLILKFIAVLLRFVSTINNVSAEERISSEYGVLPESSSLDELHKAIHKGTDIGESDGEKVKLLNRRNKQSQT